MDVRLFQMGQKPSISTIYGLLDNYLREVGHNPTQRPCPSDQDSQGLTPLDAAVLSLFLGHQPGLTIIDDHAASATLGSTSLLCAGLEQVVGLRVALPQGSAEHPAQPDWLTTLERHLNAMSQHLADRIELIPEDSRRFSEVLDQKNRRRIALISLQGLGRVEARLQIQQANQADVDAVLALGLGRVGSCPATAEWLAQANGIDGRVHLLRELEPTLGQCQLGLFTRNPDLDQIALTRTANYFIGNLDYAQLLEVQSRLLLALSEMDHLTRGFLMPSGETKSLDPRRLVDLYRHYWSELEQHRAYRASTTYRLCEQLRDRYRRLIPPGSRRERVTLKLRRAQHILASEGPLGLSSRFFRKLGLKAA